MGSPEDQVHRHLSDALRSLADCLVTADPVRGLELVEVARVLTVAQQRLAGRPSVPSGDERESGDEAIERRAAEAAARAEQMLGWLCLDPGERRFAQATGEHVVDVVTEAYRVATAAGDRLDGATITAAVAFALMVVHDPG